MASGLLYLSHDRTSSRLAFSIPVPPFAMRLAMPPLTTWSDTPGMGVGTATLNTLNRMDNEVVELPLLLPRWQATALEEAAGSRGMTTGQLLRRYITEMFAERSEPSASS